jgi:hypothetical protein
MPIVMKRLSKIALVSSVFLPYIAAAQSSVVQSVTQQATSFPQTSMNLTTFVGLFYRYINATTPVLAALAVACFFYGLVRYIYYAGDAKGHEFGRQAIIWGLVGLFVIFSLWGILQFLKLAVFS